MQIVVQNNILQLVVLDYFFGKLSFQANCLPIVVLGKDCANFVTCFWQLFFLLILHIFVQGRGGRVVAWGDQSAHSEKCQETELMVDGGSEAIALKAKSLFMLGR